MIGCESRGKANVVQKSLYGGRVWVLVRTSTLIPRRKIPHALSHQHTPHNNDATIEEKQIAPQHLTESLYDTNNKLRHGG